MKRDQRGFAVIGSLIIASLMTGVVLGGGVTPSPRTAYIRRWSVSAVPANPDAQVVIRVLILPKGSREPVYPVHLMMVKSRVAD